MAEARATAGSIAAGAALGAAFMFFFDPGRGRGRRARLRDRLVHAARAGSHALGATGRDVAHRTAGAAARLKGRLHHDVVEDDVLVERVRAQLGRVVSHPRAIHVTAERGVVTLAGAVLAAEVPRLVRATERIRGVREVVASLDEHEMPGQVPALQGARAGATFESRRPPAAWSPTERIVAGTVGVTLTGVGAARRGPSGTLLALAGVSLLTRAALPSRARTRHTRPAGAPSA